MRKRKASRRSKPEMFYASSADALSALSGETLSLRAWKALGLLSRQTSGPRSSNRIAAEL